MNRLRYTCDKFSIYVPNNIPYNSICVIIIMNDNDVGDFMLATDL